MRNPLDPQPHSFNRCDRIFSIRRGHVVVCWSSFASIKINGVAQAMQDARNANRSTDRQQIVDSIDDNVSNIYNVEVEARQTVKQGLVKTTEWQESGVLPERR